jgi:2-polyprenyl-3-methyl-5-hydroxy-6-metoxy-1,4-benzoquinol methylase
MTSQPWDKVANKFNTYKTDVWYGAADNIDAAWPIILGYIKKEFSNSQGSRALDFGCGTGMFCHELKSLGFNVTGIDISEEMIKIGKENSGDNIKLIVGDAFTAQKVSREEDGFDLITSIMVLHFLEEKDIAILCESINAGGV